MAKKPASQMDVIVSLCKRRGFVFQASEVYGGVGNTYDYGPLDGVCTRNRRFQYQSIFGCLLAGKAVRKNDGA